MAFYSNVDSTKKQRLGTKKFHVDGNQFIYLKGVGSTAVGSWVTFDENFATALLAANAVGPVAIALGAVDATTKYGWYQIYGNNTVSKSDTTAADKALYIDGTSGRVDDAVVSGDMVMNAVSTAADTSNVLPVWINYPYVNDTLG